MSRAARNVALYPFYVFCLNGFFWFPVFFLYLTSHVGLEGALLLEALYYGAVVVFEVPSGWASDRFGRRLALRTSMALLATSYALFYFGDTMLSLGVAQTFLAAGYAFNSGTDTAFHYDSLADEGRQDEYADREERIARLSFGTVALTALLGGLAATVELRLAYGVSFVTAAAGFVVTLFFTRPAPRDFVPAERLDRQLVDCARDLRDPTLAWLFGFSVLLTVLIHVPYQIYQPYLDLVDFSLPLLDDAPTPLLTGVHAFIAMVAATLVSSRSIRFARRFGLRATMLAAIGLSVAIIALAGALLHPLVAFVLFLRSVPRALTQAPLNAVVTPRVPRQRRASYLSMQSLAGRLSFSGLLLLLSGFVGSEQSSWPDISTMLLISAAVGLCGLVALALTSRFIGSADANDTLASGD